MLAWLEAILTQLFGDANAFGAHSWLELLTWPATLAIAFFAAWSLRRDSLQGRAAFLLSLYERWNELDKSREAFATLSREIRDAVRAAHGELRDEHQLVHLRTTALERLATIRRTEPDRFRLLISLLSFFEMLGAYAKNRYIPIRDVIQLYKGPILESEIIYSDFIAQWQQDAHMPPGLLTHALYLMKRTKRREEHRWLRRLL
jgi:hypothetical protein